MNENEILKERGKQYGDFDMVANTTHWLRDAVQNGTQWNQLTFREQEGILMALHKIARIVNMPYAQSRDDETQSAWRDSWIDAVNYLKLGYPYAFDDMEW